MAAIDWSGWALFGLVATTALTAVLMGAQLAGRTRMDIPLMLGTVLLADPDRARVVGAVLHVAVGQVFALGYAVTFALLDDSSVLLGAGLGLLHGLVALVVIVPLLPGVHPRMASTRAGPAAIAGLEPPGPLATNYGPETAVVTIAAHVIYGIALALLLSP